MRRKNTLMIGAALLALAIATYMCIRSQRASPRDTYDHVELIGDATPDDLAAIQHETMLAGFGAGPGILDSQRHSITL